MNKYVCFTTILILFCFWGFSQPKWAKQTPKNQDYYIGIGSIAKTESNYIDKARDIALSRIAANIAITISSESNQQVLEQAGLVSKTFESNISTFAKAQLEDYELVEKWENKKEYWVYYRLSKATYKQTMLQKQMVAKKEAAQYYKLGTAALKSNDQLTALTFFAKAAHAIGGFRGMGLRNLNEEMGSYLDVDVFVELNKLLAAIQIKSNPSFTKTSKYATHFKSVQIEASFLSDNGKLIPFESLPIKAMVPENSVEYAFVQPTNNQGQTSFKLSKINQAKNTQIKVLPDLWALAGVDNKTAFYDVFTNLNIPLAIISVNIKKPDIYVESNISRFNNDISDQIVVVSAKDKITSLKWVVTDYEDMADFILQINTTTRKGVDMQGIYTAFASGSIALIKNATGDELFRKNLPEINGGGPSFKIAGEKALENLSQKMKTEIENILKKL